MVDFVGVRELVFLTLSNVSIELVTLYSTRIGLYVARISEFSAVG